MFLAAIWSEATVLVYQPLAMYVISQERVSSILLALHRSSGRSAVRWVTGESVQAGRMMQGWLIKRFVDRDAEFVYAPNENDLSGLDATPFMVPGLPLAGRDELVEHYMLVEKNPLLGRMLQIFAAARQAYLAMRDDGAQLRGVLGAAAPPESGGLATVLYGISLTASDPAERMRLGEEVFDAVYAALGAAGRAPVGVVQRPVSR